MRKRFEQTGQVGYYFLEKGGNMLRVQVTRKGFLVLYDDNENELSFQAIKTTREIFTDSGKSFLEYASDAEFQKDFFIKLIRGDYEVKYEKGFLVIKYPFKNFAW